MKNLFTKRIETIDFKAFCPSGSSEFVAAKQKLNSLFRQQQQNSLLNCHSITLIPSTINPLAFFDVHFLIAAGAVVLISVLEKKLAENGIVDIAVILSGTLQIAFPVIAFASILILISKLGVFL
jgi:hypothetical protein